MPVATKGCVRPFPAIELLLAVTWMDTSAAAPTDNVVVPETGPRLAVMVVMPIPAEVARP